MKICLRRAFFSQEKGKDILKMLKVLEINVLIKISLRILAAAGLGIMK